MGKDELIGSIPELAHEDNTTINHIHGEGGIIKMSWYNIYGFPAEEKPGLFDQPNRFLRGTQYMGRILLSFNLMRNDNPECGKWPLPIFREPKLILHHMRIDV